MPKGLVLTEKGKNKVKNALETLEQKIKEDTELGDKYKSYRSEYQKKVDFKGFFKENGTYRKAEIVKYISFVKEKIFSKEDLQDPAKNVSIDRNKLTKILDCKDAVVENALKTLFHCLKIEEKADYTCLPTKTEKKKTKNTNKSVKNASNSLDWHDTCSKMVKQLRLASNCVVQHESAKKEIGEIYVPLALVSKKKPDKRQKGNFSPDAGTSLYQPEYETTQRFEHDAFLSKILKEGSGRSQGKKIALIGEPGAGKTTLLQTIAGWILKQELGFPIWISLADLVREENVTQIETYILDTWLKQAVSSELTAEIKTDLKKQIEQGKVWLLLDGVDEMLGGKASCQPLAEIARQLTGWINSSRVVLTCRLNVWQADFNALENFETYRLLDFNYPQQVFAFIDKWFEPDIEKGKRLEAELDRAERRRLQDLVKNPLRLFLLCRIWKEEEGNLPETKAGLYGRYRRYIYSWKQQEPPITRRQQDELDSALGQLALGDLNQGSSRFRMRERFIVKKLGYPDDENSHFYQALKIGWLNHVGYAAESASQEDVYAFYHATFEEYFAALAVESGDYFLETGTYRIFEPEWREVILLWLGREDVDDELKNQFIKSLKEFPSECGDFYGYRAYFIASVAIAEWENCPDAAEIVEQIVRWGYFDKKYGISQEARKALLQIEPKKAIKTLSDLLSDNSLDNYTCWLAAESLGRILTVDCMPIVVTKLKNYSKSNTEVYKLIWNCAQVLPYLEFYRAWNNA